jgi:hypothetical protein
MRISNLNQFDVQTRARFLLRALGFGLFISAPLLRGQSSLIVSGDLPAKRLSHLD